MTRFFICNSICNLSEICKRDAIGINAYRCVSKTRTDCGSKKKERALKNQGSCLWWRWGELNQRVKCLKLLRLYTEI